MTRLLGLWRRRLRAALVTGLLLAAVTAGWLYLAPARIGGSTTYVVTSGISMHPRFHSGDLAIVRPAARYRVGEVAAYRSSLLHVIVLHRIVAIAGGRYTFKGDNNSFVDPVRPTRAAIVGALWFRVPHGGRLLSALHSPVMAALLAAGAILLLLGFGETRRRQRRGRGAARGASMPAAEGVRGRSLDPAALLVTAGAVTVVFLALAVVAFLRPTVRPATRDVPYTQQVRFSYHAAAPAGPVYPSGAVTTGDPIFTQLVHRLSVSVDYRLASAAPAGLHGTAAVALQLTGPTGWSRTIPLARRRPFTGGHVAARVTLDLRSVQSLLAQVERLTGVSGGGYALAVVAHVHVAGRLAGRPLTAAFDPSLAFQVQPLQLQLGAGAASGSGPGAGSGGGSSSATGLSPSRHGAVVTRTTAPSTLGIGRARVSIARLRAIGLIGLVIGLVATLVLGVLTMRRRGFDESGRIRSRYGHLIVPISAGADLGWPAIDVTSMRALARLAECSGQLILHNHDELTDTYLVNDEGTVYRYQVKLPKVVWGEWSAPTVDLAGAPEPVGAPGGD